MFSQSWYVMFHNHDTLKISQSLTPRSWVVDWHKLSCLLLLPCCTSIVGDHRNSVNSNSQQKPTVGYKQTSKLLQDTSQSRLKMITNGIYEWQLKYANTIPTVICMSNGLICGYITGIYDKELLGYASCEMCHDLSEFYNY